VLYLAAVFRRRRAVARQLGVVPALRLILGGVITLAAFYLADLLTMHAIPPLTSRETGMSIMTDLHLNLSWLVTLFSVGLMAAGLTLLMNRLIPKATATLAALEKEIQKRSAELRRAHRELEREHRKVRQSERRLDLASRGAADGIWEDPAPHDDAHGEGWWSKRYRDLIAAGAATAPGTDLHWRRRIHPDDRESVLHALRAHLDERAPFDVECRLRAGEQFRWFRLSGQAEWDDAGRATHMAGSIRDVTENKLAEQRMRELNMAIENAMTGISRLDTAGVFTDVRDTYAAMLGYGDPAELIGRSWDCTVVPEALDTGRETYAAMLREGHAQAEIRALRKDGSEFVKQVLLVKIVNDRAEHEGHYCFMRDVTVEHTLATQLSHQASHDALTGLVNRVELEVRLDRAIESAISEGRTHALLYLDLDQFKVINDSCGHVAGDELLRQLASLLETRVRTNDTLARLGGDEFGVLLEDCSAEHAMRVAHELRCAVEQFTFSFDDKAFGIGASIGLVPIDARSGTKTDVLKDADAACYAAKDAGRNRVHRFRQDDIALAARQGEIQWVSRINGALAEDRLELYHQAIVPTSDAGASGKHFEVLVRLRDEDGRLVLPGAFLPAAARYGLLPRIDHWVVSRTLRWLRQHAHDRAFERCHINLSGPSLASGEFLDFVLRELDVTGIDPRRICFEITENAAISNLVSARHFIKTCRARGCAFALDDFGSGLSSFGYLKNLAVDFVKIDGVFVRDMLEDPVDLAMVRAIHDVARVVGAPSIAEFVESRETLEALQSIGVDYAQGYWIGRPEPLEPGIFHTATPGKRAAR
jgi:diguanylate cyclase (GGDEF)-like protein/PAS domain S-box-containing protein